MSSSRRLALLVLLCAVITVGLVFGVRQSFGLFLRPMSLDLGWGRETLSLVFALQALMNGLAAPFAGAIADKWGTGRTVMVGGGLYALGLLVMAHSVSPAAMLVGGGLLVGMGVSACGLPVMLAVVARSAPEASRSLWMGTVTAGATAGQLAIIPIAQWAIAWQGWSAALTVLASGFVVLVPLAACFAMAGRRTAKTPHTQTLKEALGEARGHSGYLLLTIGFFVCGFQVQFVATHLPAFIEDRGLGAGIAANALVTIALFNMFGAWLAGYLGGTRRKKYLLSGIYLTRAVVIALFVSVPVTETTVLLFSAAIGLIWLGTVPLTSGLIVQMFGARYLATLYAIVYLSHQLGNFAGAWVGGRVFDATGSYQTVWWIAVGLGVAAAVVHAPIDDRPVARLAART